MGDKSRTLQHLAEQFVPGQRWLGKQVVQWPDARGYIELSTAVIVMALIPCMDNYKADHREPVLQLKQL